MHNFTFWFYLLTFGLAQKLTNSQLISSQFKESQNLKHCQKFLSVEDQNVILPRIYLSKKPTHSLNTYSIVDQAHHNHISIKYNYQGEKHRLKLQKNRVLSRAGRWLNYTDCYYQGSCTRKAHTGLDRVSLSTCHGLNGMIEINGEAYAISPLLRNTTDKIYELCHPHLLVKISNPKNRSFRNESSLWLPFKKLHAKLGGDAAPNSLNKTLHQRVKRNAETSFIGLAVVLDKAMMRNFNNSQDDAHKYMLQVANMVDMFYQKLNVRVGLVHQEYWITERITESSNPREILNDFLQYSQQIPDRSEYDIVHLISGKYLDAESIGLSIPDSICTDRSVAVISGSLQQSPTASLIAHMIGHTLGLNHDIADCRCMQPDGCIMSDKIANGSPRDFSSCSIQRWRELQNANLGSCLRNEPESNPFPQFCGNGFVERGEQCDCGRAAVCDDPCCDPKTCLLVSWATCHEGACCNNCQVKVSSEVCRDATSSCDVPEYCNGISGDCPADVIVQNGQPCNEGDGYCWNGKCPTRDTQCQRYWGDNSGSANDECYSYNNVLGVRYGHCGQGANLGDYVKCAENDIQCGLLQCKEGSAAPVQSAGIQLDYRQTSTGVNGNHLYRCKTVGAVQNSDLFNVGMVSDGTKCAADKICYSHQCTDINELLPSAKCPRSDTNITCSGHGRCTTAGRCYCDVGYRGGICDEMLPDYTGSGNPGSVTDSSPENSGVLETKWLILIVLCVTILFVLVTLLIAFFCRNKIKTPQRKKKLKPQLFSSNISEVSSELDRDRTISFGQTPSYKTEKSEASPAKRKRRRKRRPSSTDEDSDSDSKNTTSTAPRDVIIPKELAREPERGILKNGGGKGLKLGKNLEDCSRSQCSCSDGGSSCSCSDDSCTKPQNHIIDAAVTVEFPPPAEFESDKPTNVNEIATSRCQEPSPTNSEQMKYCETEADQYYKHYMPSKPEYIQLSTIADSATDSAIDMQPGEGSVSTINEIPPHHLISQYKNVLHGNLSSQYASPMSQSQSETSSDYNSTMSSIPNHSTVTPHPHLQAQKSDTAAKLAELTPKLMHTHSPRDYINPRVYEVPTRGTPRAVYNTNNHTPGYLKPSADNSNTPNKFDAITV